MRVSRRLSRCISLSSETEPRILRIKREDKQEGKRNKYLHTADALNKSESSRASRDGNSWRHEVTRRATIYCNRPSHDTKHSSYSGDERRPHIGFKLVWLDPDDDRKV